MSKEYIEAFETVYNNIDYLISDIVIEDDEVNGCLMTIKEQLSNIKHALHRLESIDNAEPSEALEILDDFKNGLVNKEIGMVMFQQYWFFTQIEKVKQALLKAQEPKQYLKWEDLKSSNSEERLNVKLNNIKYELHFEKWAKYDDATRISLYLNEFCVMSIRLKTDYDKQFFNDLHLERVEE